MEVLVETIGIRSFKAQKFEVERRRALDLRLAQLTFDKFMYELCSKIDQIIHKNIRKTVISLIFNHSVVIRGLLILKKKI
jgi:hypothetical protein